MGKIIKKNETITSILERYYLQKLNNNLISERTYAIYQSIIGILKKEIPNIPICMIQIQDIENLSKSIRNFSNETITKIWNSLKLAFRIASNRHIIHSNIMLDETLIKPNSIKNTSKIEALTIKQQTRLIQILKRDLKRKPQYTSIIYACLLCIYTGMRIGETLGICKDAINIENNTLTIKRTLTTDIVGKLYLSEHTKTYKIGKNIDTGKRTFLMIPKVKKIIKNLMDNNNSDTPNQILFWNYHKNSYISSNDINRYLQRLNDKYEIIEGRLHSHILRHTFITRCVESGMNIKVIQYLVGHTYSSTLTLDIYTSVSSDFIRNEFQKLAI